jgi:SAM-dependent methyltransferase
MAVDQIQAVAELLQGQGLTFDTGTSLWRKPGQLPFAYSDGDRAERYLHEVVAAVRDLDTQSFELERRIQDWPSEYHLTRKRAQLLCGLRFERAQRVLEIGSGCGAITRFLGETFGTVVGVEGSARRAGIARARTRDLPNVHLAVAPFQEVRFQAAFDSVFVIGVLEYAASFETGAGDPYEAFVRRCHESLTDEGTLVLAIENQLGLKYFAGMSEDHTRIPFDGIEGYASQRTAVRTFGRVELEQRLRRYFDQVAFYYPFPDYKIPSAVLSEAALQELSVAGVVGRYPVRDYARPSRQALFDAALVWEELERNRIGHLFAPSFLIVAGKAGAKLPEFDGLGAAYSAGRKPEFQTVTRIVRTATGAIETEKQRRQGSGSHSAGALTLQSLRERWMPEPTLSTRLQRRCRVEGATLETAFADCAPWFAWLREVSGSATCDGMIDGRHVDALWDNAVIRDGACVFIDQEWLWSEPLSARVLVIRSIDSFLKDDSRSLAQMPALAKFANGRDLITRVAALFGVKLEASDFEAFASLEARLQHLVFGKREDVARARIVFRLNHPRAHGQLSRLKSLTQTRIGMAIARRLRTQTDAES